MDSSSGLPFVQTIHERDQLVYGASEFLRKFQIYRTGASTDYQMVSDLTFDDFHAKAMGSTSLDEIKKKVRDANEYVMRQHFTISLLQPNLFAFYQPWLKGYNC